MSSLNLSVFDAPHKGIRNAFSIFIEELGHSDPSNEHSLNRLKTIGNDVFDLLIDHAENEEQCILQILEKKQSEIVKNDREDYEKTEKMILILKDRLNSFSINSTSMDLYHYLMEFTKFQSIYLIHMVEEETETQKQIEKHFTEIEMLEFHTNSTKRMLSNRRLLSLWFKYIFPARQVEDNREMLKLLKENLPEEAFNIVEWSMKHAFLPIEYQEFVSKP